MFQTEEDEPTLDPSAGDPLTPDPDIDLIIALLEALEDQLDDQETLA